jgi:hypothetical protein
MTNYEKIVKQCEDSLIHYNMNESFAYQTGYYKAQVKILCQEVEFLKQELESTIEQIKEISKDLA